MYRLPSPLSHSLVDETLSSSSQRLKVENTISTSSSSAARVSSSQVVFAITPHPPRQRRRTRHRDTGGQTAASPSRLRALARAGPVPPAPHPPAAPRTAASTARPRRELGRVGADSSWPRC